MQLVGVAPGGSDLVGVPFGGSPVEGFAGVYYVVEGSDGLFNGGVAVGTVGIDQIYVFEAETFERGVDSFNDCDEAWLALSYGRGSASLSWSMELVLGSEWILELPEYRGRYDSFGDMT